MKGLVDTHGWAIMCVYAQAPVCYTLGLFATKGLPELVVSGLPPETGQSILNTLASRLVTGELKLDSTKDYADVFEGFPARFRPLPPETAELLNLAQAFAPAGYVAPAWQLLWPGTDGRFPGDTDCSTLAHTAQEVGRLLARDDESSKS